MLDSIMFIPGQKYFGISKEIIPARSDSFPILEKEASVFRDYVWD